MERKEVAVYLYLGILIIAAILAVYLFNPKPTGFVVLEQYTDEVSCVGAGHTWTNSTNESCIDIPECVVCISGCVTNYTETLCEEGCQQTCDENATGCVVCTPGCVVTYTEILCEEGCQENCQNCTTIVSGGQCTGIICDSDNLDLCLNEADCSNADGYWYDDVCNDEEQEETPESNETEIESTVQVPIQPEQQDIIDLSLQAIEKSTLNPLNSKNLNLVVNNMGNVPLSACSLSAGGNYASWLSISEASQNINIGETKNFAFSMKVPEDATEGTYSFSLSVQCAEIMKNSEFSVDIIKKKIEFNITEVERTRKDRVVVYYSLQELLDEEQNISLQFFLYDAVNSQAGNASINQILSAGESDDFKTNIAINESLDENTTLTLTANVNSEKYSVSVKEPIVLGAPTGFFVLGDDLGTTGNVFAIVILIVVVAGVFFLIKRMKVSKKSNKQSV